MVEEKKTKSVSDLFWGRTKELPFFTRIGWLVFLFAVTASVTFLQLGLWPVGDIDYCPVYLILLSVPIIVGAYGYGPIVGGLLGLFGGCAALIHGTFLPLDLLETYYFGIPTNTLGVFTLIGIVAGLLFNFALKKDIQGGARIATITIIAVFVSFLTSALLLTSTVITLGGFDLFKLAATYLGISFASSAVQALVDSVLVAAMCLLADHLIRKAIREGNERPLYTVFRNFLILVSTTIFMISSAFIFSNTTLQELENAHEDMDGELGFLLDQFTYQPDLDIQLFVGEYEKDTDGIVFTTNSQGDILVSNDDEKFKVGTSILTALGQGDYLGDENNVGAVLDYYSSGREPVTMVRDTDEDLMPNVNIALLGIRKYKDGYIAHYRTSDLIYANRANTMIASTALALILVTAIGILISIFVRRLIVRRIEETNLALTKITAGQLSERVPEQSTLEFTSLANGINSTVQALSDMIEEVAKRNEQDLATAKTIQESSLPTEFPAFPNIDKFDIYASMKTAKEVGGDFYDFFFIEDTTKIGFVMADVSGKGIPAALFMMAARSQLRNFMEAGLPVNEAVDAANHQLCIGNDAGMFVTCWVGEFDYVTGELAYVNAGHNPPMFMHDRTWDWMNNVSGMPLGLFDGIPYDLFTMQLVTGDMLYTYTDGVTEAMNSDDELFGEDRLEAVLNKSKNMNPRSVGVAVRRALTDYTQDAEQSDDITMLILKYGVPPEAAAVMALSAYDTQVVHVRNFISAELDRRKAPKHVYEEIEDFAEKVFLSACENAYPNATPDDPGEVRVEFEFQQNPAMLRVTISDDGVLYDPLANLRDLANSGEDSDGSQTIDEISYERVNGSNVVSFAKSW